MTASKQDLLSGTESATAEAKRLFAAIDFGPLTKSEFVRKMLQGVVADAYEVHTTVKHLEAVWRGKAAPTMAELEKAKRVVSGELEELTKTERFLQKMGAYQPKYDTTKKLQSKFNEHKK